MYCRSMQTCFRSCNNISSKVYKDTSEYAISRPKILQERGHSPSRDLWPVGKAPITGIRPTRSKVLDPPLAMDSRILVPCLWRVEPWLWDHDQCSETMVGTLRMATGLQNVTQAMNINSHQHSKISLTLLSANLLFRVNLLLLVCVSFTIIGQPRNSVFIRRV